jgi:hypothetical protein
LIVKRHARETELEKKIPATEARQGRQGAQILMVLVVGLVLAGAVWLGLEFYGESIDRGSAEQPGATDQVDPATTQPNTSQPQTSQ